MNKLLVKLSVTATVGGLLGATPTLAQLPSAPRNSNVAMTQQPTLESAYDDVAIIRWSVGNPGGSDDHFGVVHYGTNPSALTETTTSHIRLNRAHAESLFRVRMQGLQPGKTYYYKVTSMEANGTSDGVESGVGQFTMPMPGQRTMHYPQPSSTAR